LEARNRLGGRTFTSEFAGKEADMGGTWVHWLQPHVWSEIRRYGMTLTETPGAVAEDIIYLDYQGKRHQTKASKIWAEFEASVAKFFGNAYETMPRPADPFVNDAWIKADTFSVQQKLNTVPLSPDMKVFVDTLFTLYGSNDLSQISWVDMMRWYALSGYNATVMNDATARYKIAGGTKILLDAMAADAGADVRLSTPVKSVRQAKDLVEVVTEDGTRLTAKAVVCAVPMNVLKDVQFSPALPAGKIEPSRQKHAANGTKVHVLLKGEYPMMSLWAPTGKVPLNFVMWDNVTKGNTHFIGFGPTAETLDINDTDAVQAAFRQFLPQAEVLEAYGYQWDADPYSQGVWGVSRPGQMSKYLKSLQEPQGRVIFANSDWANGWRGFIDGAIEQGIMGVMNCVTHGSTMVFPSDAFEPGAVLEAVQGERCTALYGVPTMFVAELAHPDFAKFDLSTLRTGIMAGAPCPIEVMKRVVSDMHMSEVTICYGMTETSPVSFQTRADADLETRVATVGTVHPFVEVKIVDDRGRVVPRGQTGELLTRGYSVMAGYWADPERTAEAIDSGGWMHTGDLATVDDQGRCKIVGRAKDMVIRGGENVYPAEIETSCSSIRKCSRQLSSASLTRSTARKFAPGSASARKRASTRSLRTVGARSRTTRCPSTSGLSRSFR
jgi:pseudooxynicotine oxidase